MLNIFVIILYFPQPLLNVPFPQHQWQPHLCLPAVRSPTVFPCSAWLMQLQSHESKIKFIKFPQLRVPPSLFVLAPNGVYLLCSPAPENFSHDPCSLAPPGTQPPTVVKHVSKMGLPPTLPSPFILTAARHFLHFVTYCATFCILSPTAGIIG